MGVFVYRARDPGGQMVNGKIDAQNEQELISRLRNQGFLVLGVERDRDLQTLVQSPTSFFSRRVNGRDLAVFSRQFATMINAGLPVVTGIKVLARQASNRRLSNALTQVASDVEAGESLQVAFARQNNVFPTVMVQMIAAGEVGGILDEVMTRLANQLEKEETLRQKVRSALVYPGIVSTVAVLVVVFLMTFVVPKFVAIYQDMTADLPFLTKMLIAISGAFEHYWWVITGLLIAVIVGYRYWVRTDQGAIMRDRLLLRMPIVGPMLIKQSVARFGRTLGGLLSSGIDILKGLAVVERTVGNRVVALSVRDALDAVRQGQRLAAPLRASGIYPPMVLEMISIGEETGTVEEMLTKVADFYDEEVQRTAERLSTSIEPIIIVFLAITVGGIVASMMLPVFNMWSMIG